METNEMFLEFDSKSENEGFARITVAAFATKLDPTLDEIADIKMAVSEAVTNAIIHGYENQDGKIQIRCCLEGNRITVQVKDEGTGIADIQKAMEPLYTTRPEWERSGMGFTFMETFMDHLEVESAPGKGTIVRMDKQIGIQNE